MRLAVQAIGRPDAGPDAILLAALDLRDQMRVGDVRPRHADQIGDAFVQDMPRRRHVPDAGGVHDRQRDLSAEAPHLGQERRAALEHAGHVVLGQQQIAVHPAIDAVEEVNMAFPLQHVGDFKAFVHVQPVLAPSSTT